MATNVVVFVVLVVLLDAVVKVSIPKALSFLDR